MCAFWLKNSHPQQEVSEHLPPIQCRVINMNRGKMGRRKAVHHNQQTIQCTFELFFFEQIYTYISIRGWIDSNETGIVFALCIAKKLSLSPAADGYIDIIICASFVKKRRMKAVGIHQ